MIQNKKNSGEPPPAVTSCPPGLEPLLGVTHLFIQRKLTEKFYNAPAKLSVTTNSGASIFDIVAVDKLTVLTSVCSQTFDLVISSNGQNILEMTGEYGLSHICGTLSASAGITCHYSPLENIGNAGISVGFGDSAFGHVNIICRTSTSCCFKKPRKPNYEVINDQNEVQLDLISTQKTCCRGSSLKGSPTFKLLSVDETGTGKVVGRISEHWKKVGTIEKHTLGVSFPAEMDVRNKATLLGAILLLNFQTYNRDFLPLQLSHYGLNHELDK